MAHWTENVLRLLEAETDDLTELARMVGAEPKTFYRGANFRCADLSSEDLSRFDLTGALTSDAVLIDQQRWTLIDNEERAKLFALLQIDRLPGDPEASANWPEYALLAPKVEKNLKSLRKLRGLISAVLLRSMAEYHLNTGDYPGGLRLAQVSLVLMRARLPEDHRNIALGLSTLGAALSRVGRLDEAEAMLAEAVALNEAHRLGTADLAESYNLHGGILLDLARDGRADLLPRAARRFQQALALRRRLAGRRSDPVATALNNLGLVRAAQGRGAAAARLYAASLSIWRAVLAPDDARLAYGAMNAGAAWLESGAADRAEALLREALEIREKALAAQPRHPERVLAADWLIACLMVRARAGENRGLREMQARLLCDRYGFDFEERQAKASHNPYTPPAP